MTREEGEALAKKLNAGFIESSAKDNKNVGTFTNLSLLPTDLQAVGN